MAIQAIWKDTFVEFNTANSPIDYVIYKKNSTTGDEPIFYGKAWCPPSHSTATFKTKINTICENYVKMEMGDFNKDNVWSGSVTNSLTTFYVADSAGTKLLEVTFVYDWSYDDTIDYNSGEKIVLSRPINNRGVRGMFHFKTTFDGSKIQTGFNKTVTGDWEEVSTCSDDLWALYYLNRYGGWDSFLIEGYVSKTDKFERHNITKEYNNNSSDGGEKPYLTNITTEYEIHTGWLNDKQSEVLASNLLQSTRVFLHKIGESKFKPVIITDADVLYKNHKNSGRRLLNYTINVRDAQVQHNKN